MVLYSYGLLQTLGGNALRACVLQTLGGNALRACVLQTLGSNVWSYGIMVVCLLFLLGFYVGLTWMEPFHPAPLACFCLVFALV